MKKALIIFGNITFEDDKVIIHEVHNTLSVDRDKVEDVADSLVNLYDGYIIPSINKLPIVWEH